MFATIPHQLAFRFTCKVLGARHLFLVVSTATLLGGAQQALRDRKILSVSISLLSTAAYLVACTAMTALRTAVLATGEQFLAGVATSFHYLAAVSRLDLHGNLD